VNLGNYWQENKRFVTVVAGGALVFLIGYLVLSGRYGSSISGARGQLARLEGDLRKAHYTSADRDAAIAENDALRSSVETLAARAHFAPRAGFRIDRGAGAPSPSSQYLRALNAVRDDLLPRANRANVKLDAGLGMPALSPTREDLIERHLEALDVVDTVLGMAIACGVARVESIAVRTDPGLSSRQGVGPIERTQIQFSFEGRAQPLVELLARTQRAPDGRALLVHEVELIASKSKPGDARLDLTLVAARLAAPEETEESL
jgi:hypothetical protein